MTIAALWICSSQCLEFDQPQLSLKHPSGPSIGLSLWRSFSCNKSLAKNSATPMKSWQTHIVLILVAFIVQDWICLCFLHLDVELWCCRYDGSRQFAWSWVALCPFQSTCCVDNRPWTWSGTYHDCSRTQHRGRDICGCKWIYRLHGTVLRAAQGMNKQADIATYCSDRNIQICPTYHYIW